MSECRKELYRAGKPSPRTCGLCGLGPCKNCPAEDPRFIVGAFGVYPRPTPPSGGFAVQRPPLSHETEIDARARAADLAIKAYGPLPQDPETLARFFEVSNRFYEYLVSGK